MKTKHEFEEAIEAPMHLVERRPPHIPEAPISTCSPGQEQARKVPHGAGATKRSRGAITTRRASATTTRMLRMHARW